MWFPQDGVNWVGLKRLAEVLRQGITVVVSDDKDKDILFTVNIVLPRLHDTMFLNSCFITFSHMP